MSPVGPSSLLTRHFQDSWRRLSGASGASSSPTGRRLTDSLLFEVTDASVVQDGSSKYVVSSSRYCDGGGRLDAVSVQSQHASYRADFC